MGRVLVPLLLLLVVAGVYLAIKAMKTFLRRQRQRQLAMFAPELLAGDTDIDPQVVKYLVAQQTQLNQGRILVKQILDDPVLMLPTEYHQPLTEWLSNPPKEIR